MSKNTLISENEYLIAKDLVSMMKLIYPNCVDECMSFEDRAKYNRSLEIIAGYEGKLQGKSYYMKGKGSEQFAGEYRAALENNDTLAIKELESKAQRMADKHSNNRFLRIIIHIKQERTKG